VGENKAALAARDSAEGRLSGQYRDLTDAHRIEMERLRYELTEYADRERNVL
jgi:hypothetical protein